MRRDETEAAWQWVDAIASGWREAGMVPSPTRPAHGGPVPRCHWWTGLVTAGANKGSTMAWIEHEYPDPQALVAGVSAVFEATCRSAIAAHGSALLCLAGGRTPLPIYAHLAHARLRGTLTAIPGDERCVPHTHAACNLRNLREAFATDASLQKCSHSPPPMAM